MAAPTRGADMARNPLTTMEYLDRLAADANINFLVDQREGDGIPRAVDLNVIAGGHAGAFPPRVYWRAKT